MKDLTYEEKKEKLSIVWHDMKEHYDTLEKEIEAV